MSIVSFQLTPQLDRSEQDRLLTEIRRLPGVVLADRIDPESQHPLVMRMCAAETADDQTATEVVHRLEQLKEVLLVERPEKRELIW